MPVLLLCVPIEGCACVAANEGVGGRITSISDRDGLALAGCQKVPYQRTLSSIINITY